MVVMDQEGTVELAEIPRCEFTLGDIQIFCVPLIFPGDPQDQFPLYSLLMERAEKNGVLGATTELLLLVEQRGNTNAAFFNFVQGAPLLFSEALDDGNVGILKYRSDSTVGFLRKDFIYSGNMCTHRTIHAVGLISG